MDQLVSDIVGKLTLNKPASITVIADNFSLLEDEALFLKAAYAIPDVKKLPFSAGSKVAIQIGRHHRKLAEQFTKFNWLTKEYHSDPSSSICERIQKDLTNLNKRSIIYISEVSSLEFEQEPYETSELLSLVHRLKITKGHFFVLIYQNSWPSSPNKFLDHLQYMSDAVVRVSSCKVGYFKSIWWQTIPQTRTLLAPKVETLYCTCRIGKFFWSSDLYCFYQQRKVPKHHDLNSDSHLNDSDIDSPTVERTNFRLDYDDDNEEKQHDKEDQQMNTEDPRSAGRSRDSTLPYMKAQNPEQTRIFYYPDKEDDIDEDDPDNDLCI